jgi:GntR family transcriptional regulator, transcriptional repressor for pyruvate dehydrogenase complex
MTSAPDRHDKPDSAATVVAHVRELIDRGALGPGARLPPERDLARQVGVSRPTVRAGLRTLAALGVVRSRRGSGTYIPEGPPSLGAEALSFLAALHKFTVDDVYEARRILEVGAAGIAAERATPDQLATLADEVSGLFASLNDRQVFLVHDINFHRSIAAASGNPIVASLVEMVSALYYERRRTTAERAVDRDLRDAADAHRHIYQAVRAKDVERARRLMHDHLLRARSYQAKEVLASTFKVQGPSRSASEKREHAPGRPASPANSGRNSPFVPREARLLGAGGASLRRAPRRKAAR